MHTSEWKETLTTTDTSRSLNSLLISGTLGILRKNSTRQTLCSFHFWDGSELAGGQNWFFHTQEHFPAPPDGPSGILRPDGTFNPCSERWVYSTVSSQFNVPGNPKPHSIVFVHLTPSVLLGIYEESHMAGC